MDDRPRLDLDLIPCPVCGVIARTTTAVAEDSILTDPLLATPLARLCALAVDTEMVLVENIRADLTVDVAGAVGLGVDEHGDLRGMVCLAVDLDDALRADVLAFGIAAYLSETRRIVHSPSGYLGIGRERLPAAEYGPGHLAWHLARTCGRLTPSATFELTPL